MIDAYLDQNPVYINSVEVAELSLPLTNPGNESFAACLPSWSLFLVFCPMNILRVSGCSLKTSLAEHSGLKQIDKFFV